MIGIALLRPGSHVFGDLAWLPSSVVVLDQKTFHAAFFNLYQKVSMPDYP